MEEKHLAVLRRHMVEVVAIHAELASDVLGKSALDARVVAAMGRVPRHAFVPAPLLRYAYDDMPLPIGFDKTISQPFMVAVMTDLLEPRPDDVVLEVGTGLGYQTAILAELTGRVWSVEIVEELASEAELRLLQLGYTNVGIRVGDGGAGLAGACAVRQDPLGCGCGIVPTCLGRAAAAGRSDGVADWSGGRPAAERGREECERGRPRSCAHAGAVHSA